MNKHFIIDNEEQMAQVAIELLQDINTLFKINPNNYANFINLNGNLGAGKTTLVRYILRQLDFIGKVKSPTYTFMESYNLEFNPYNFNFTTLHHFDLYRFNDANNWLEYGFDEYLNFNSLVFIEWANMAKKYLSNPLISLNLEIKAEKRIITW